MSRRLTIALLLGPPLLAAIAFTVVRARYAMTIPAPIPDDARAAVMRTLRGALEGRPAEPPGHPALSRPLPDGGPVIASLWQDGRRALRVEGRGPTVAAATADAAARLAGARPEGRLQVDIVVARGRLATSLPFALLPVDPGRDGIGAPTGGGHEVLVAADELSARSLLDSKAPLAGAPDVKIGVDRAAVEAELALRAGLPLDAFRRSRGPLFRFRAESFVEPPGAAGPPLPVERGLVPGPPVTAETLLAGAVAGARYLTAHLGANGRFVYELDLATGRATDPTRPPYGLARHAGTAYYLAQVHAVTRDPALRAALERALGELADLAQRGSFDDGTRYACVLDRGERTASMGTTALAAVAFAEYRLTTGDQRHDELLRELLAWILAMERKDGGFTHYFVLSDRRRLPARALYYDGEAALALVRGARVFGDARYLAAGERALDYLVSWTDSFAGKFFFGEDHWTCIAAAAAWPDLQHDRYRAFCSAFGAFLRRLQFLPGEPGDFEGGYGITTFLVPRNTPVGSRTEAMLSAYELGRLHGRPEEALRRQILGALGYLLRQQIRPDNSWWIPVPAAEGAMAGSTVDPVVRIDNVQHTGSAMLRAIELVR